MTKRNAFNILQVAITTARKTFRFTSNEYIGTAVVSHQGDEYRVYAVNDGGGFSIEHEYKSPFIWFGSPDELREKGTK
jgi:hypothetical protein